MCWIGWAAVAGRFIASITGRKDDADLEPPSDDYFLGQELGRGSYGIVYSCTHRGTQLQYAVKRVSKRTSSADSIDQEVAMLQKLAHPSVVRLHGVYSNRFNVDMVFSLCSGGDLLDAMNAHWKSKGAIPMAAVQKLSRQMFQGIAWLRQHNVVHRDVKADNYLLDRADVGHPECVICLCDFGCAVGLKPGESLARARGTECFWAPEIYAQSYAHEVDVWAAGVTMYGMVLGTFPFSAEKEVLRKRVKVPSRCGEAGRSFLLGTLERSVAKRLTAKAALDHPFLAPLASSAPAAPAPAATPEAAAPLRPPAPDEKEDEVGCGAAAGAPLAQCRSEATTTASSCSDSEHLL